MSNSDVGDRPPAENGTDNVIAGGVSGTSVQAGSIQGGVHIHRTAAPGPEIVPRQLPPPPAHVTGRSAEFATLDQIASRDDDRHGPAVVVVSGQGGVGKSALALWWLHGVADRYPDGQLYVDLSTEPKPDPVSLSSVLGRLLRAFGLAADRIPAEVDEAAALFRSVTADKRVAMLVDNPMSSAQVRTLLPTSPASVVIVATRWRLGGLAVEGAGFVPLSPFGIDLGAKLLRHSLGEQRAAREPHEVERLVELCGGLPIALSIAAARLVTRPEWPVGRLVRGLSDESRRLSTLEMVGEMSVPQVFDVSYSALSISEARTYRWLGVLAGPSFRVGCVAAVLELSIPDAEDVLDALVDANLLEVVDVDRYRFHELVRLHARERAEREDTTADRNAIVRRFLEYHLAVTAVVDRAVMPLDWRIGPAYQQLDKSAEPPGSAAMLDELEADLPNLMAALRAGVDFGLDELVWQLCEAMWSLFLYRKHFPDWLAAHQMAVAAADRCGAQVAKSRMSRRLGLAFHNLNRPDEAIVHAETALTTAQAAANERAESEALRLIGMANRARGRLDDAVLALTRTVELVERLGLSRDEALARRALGQTLTAAGRYADAVAELRRAKEIAGALPDDNVEANTTVWLADALARAGRPDEAADLAAEASSVLRDSGASQYEAQALMVWGVAAAATGDLLAARDRLTRARDLYAQLGTGHAFSAGRTLDDVEARLSASEPGDR